MHEFSDQNEDRNSDWEQLGDPLEHNASPIVPSAESSEPDQHDLPPPITHSVEATEPRPSAPSGDIHAEVATDTPGQRLILGIGQMRPAIIYFAGKAAEAGLDLEAHLSDRQREALALFTDSNVPGQEIEDRLGTGKVSVNKVGRQILGLLEGMEGPDMPDFRPSVRSLEQSGTGAEINVIRQQRQVVASNLASAMDVSLRTLDELFAGNTYPDALMVERLLERLAVPADQAVSILERYEAEKIEVTGRPSRSGIAAEIAVLSRGRGVTRAQLADAGGVAPATVGRVLAGGSTDPSVIAGMFELLGMSERQIAERMDVLAIEEAAARAGAAQLHTIGPLIKDLMISGNVPRAEMVELAGSTSGLEKILAGKTFTRPETIERLLQRLNLSDEAVEIRLAEYSEQRDARNLALDRVRSIAMSDRRREERERR